MGELKCVKRFFCFLGLFSVEMAKLSFLVYSHKNILNKHIENIKMVNNYSINYVKIFIYCISKHSIFSKRSVFYLDRVLFLTEKCI